MRTEPCHVGTPASVSHEVSGMPVGVDGGPLHASVEAVAVSSQLACVGGARLHRQDGPPGDMG